MSLRAGQHVRIKASGAVGKVFLKLPLEEVYLVQMPGFPVVEKLYYGSELELVAVETEEHQHQHA